MHHFDLVCSCGAYIFTPSERSAREFNQKHFAMRHVVRVRDGASYPVVRRFVIRRHHLDRNTDAPWTLRDRSRPAYLGHFATLALALAAVYRKVGDERGYVPTRREIREAMTEPTA